MIYGDKFLSVQIIHCDSESTCFVYNVTEKKCECVFNESMELDLFTDTGK